MHRVASLVPRISARVLQRRPTCYFAPLYSFRVPQVLENGSKRIFSTETDANPDGSVVETVVGVTRDASLEISTAHIGQVIDIPFENTISSGMEAIWHSSFYQRDRMFTSAPFARSLGLPNIVLPFSFMLFKATSMSHVDSSKQVLEVAFSRANYHRPAFVGDTLSKSYIIKSLKPSSNNRNTNVVVACNVYNDKKELVFSCDKLMTYYDTWPKRQGGAHKEPQKLQPMKTSEFVNYLEENDFRLKGTSSRLSLEPNSLLIHSLGRPLGRSQSWSLSTLFRMNHPLIFDQHKYGRDGLVIPGGLLCAQALACSARSLEDTLWESTEHCLFVNKAAPYDTISAMTYVRDVEPYTEHIERVKVTTFGIKNLDMETLEDRIPVRLFTDLSSLTPSKIEQLLQDHCPKLQGKLVVGMERVLYRSAVSSGNVTPLL